MARKIYIGRTYITRQGEDFTVVKLEKGKKSNSTDRRARKCRVAINEKGDRRKITGLYDIKNICECISPTALEYKNTVTCIDCELKIP